MLKGYPLINCLKGVVCTSYVYVMHTSCAYHESYAYNLCVTWKLC